jgi:hypothetical protein
VPHKAIRGMRRPELQHLVELFHDEECERELKRRDRQSARSLSRRPARKPRARSQPGGNPTLKTFIVQGPSGPRKLRMGVGQFITYDRIPKTIGRDPGIVDFDALAKVPVHKIFTLARD